MQQITFPNHAGERLAATLHRPETNSAAGVVFGHCFTCSRHTTVLRRLGAALEKAGFWVLRFDFSGNGASEGTFAESTYSKQQLELQAASRYLRNLGVAWIGLGGHSMGAAAAVLVAADTPGVGAVAALAVRRHTTFLEQLLAADSRQQLQDSGQVQFTSRGRRLELTADFFADGRRHDLPAAVKNLRIPLLLVHGDRDQMVPLADAHYLQSLNPNWARVAVIAGADHMFSGEAAAGQVVEAVTGWFRRHAAGAGRR